MRAFILQCVGHETLQLHMLLTAKLHGNLTTHVLSRPFLLQLAFPFSLLKTLLYPVWSYTPVCSALGLQINAEGCELLFGLRQIEVLTQINIIKSNMNFSVFSNKVFIFQNQN